MPWRETNVMEERIRFVAEAIRGKVNFSRLCREYGICRSTGYRWLGRYHEVGSFSLLREKSRRPHRSPNKTPEEYEQRIVALRREYGWGGRKLRKLLLDEGIELPVVTINRIIDRQGLISPQQRHKKAVKRFERSKPNELWQMDFKGQYRMPGGWCYPLTIMDDHSRYVVGLYGLGSQGADGVYASIVEVFERYGLPEAILMDHGTPWWSTTNGHGLTWVSVGLIKQGISIYLSGIGHPQTQGKVERFHRTLAERVRQRGRPRTYGGWDQMFREFRWEYNQIRPHEALGMEVPASRYRQSSRAYDPEPREWEYGEGSDVRRLNSQGCLEFGGCRYFVCEALAGERVCVEEAESHLLVSYRHMYIREIEVETGRTRALILPNQHP